MSMSIDTTTLFDDLKLVYQKSGLQKSEVMKEALNAWETRNSAVVNQFEEWLVNDAIPKWNVGEKFTLFVGTGAGAGVTLGDMLIGEFVEWLKLYGWQVEVTKQGESGYSKLLLW